MSGASNFRVLLNVGAFTTGPSMFTFGAVRSGFANAGLSMESFGEFRSAWLGY